MAIQKKNRADLRNYFQTGDRPTQGQFEELIESVVNITEDKATDTEITTGTSNDKFVTVAGAKKSARTSITVNGNTANQSTGDIQVTTITGNAGTASKLATPRSINGVAFDGSQNINLPATTTISGNAGTASTLQTARNINGFPFNGSADVFTQSIFNLNASFPSSNVARANVAGLSFNAVAGKRYKIEIIGDYQTVALTTGGSLGFVMTSGTATIKGLASMQINVASPNALGLTTSITAINATNTTAGSFITSTGVSALNIPHNLYANLVLTCVTSGVFQVQWGSEVAGSAATLNGGANAGTVMIVTQLN